MEYVWLVLFIVFFCIAFWTIVVRRERFRQSIERRTTALSAAAISVYALIAHLLVMAHMPLVLMAVVLVVLVPLIGRTYRIVRLRIEKLQ